MRILAQGPLFQRGRRRQPLQAGKGLGNLLGSLARGLIPITKSILRSPITRAIAKKGLAETANVASDLLQGSSLSEAAGKRLTKASHELISKLQQRNKPPPPQRQPRKNRRGPRREVTKKIKRSRKPRMKHDLFM